MLALLLAFTFGFNSFAADTAKTAKTAKRATASTNFSEPQSLENCTPPATAEESQARQQAESAGLSKEELLARLIYSESLSTGYWNQKCLAESRDAIMKSIGWGIMNRVKDKASTSLSTYMDVIFGKNQFRTSFSGKKVNPFAKAFLCPLGADVYLKTAVVKTSAAELYKKAGEIAEAIVQEYESSGIPAKYKDITNFFYPESEFFGEMRPKWAPNKNALQNKGYVDTVGAESKPCVESYRLK